MSNQPYLKSCDRCQDQIKMQQINGKWAAYSSDGTSFHKCSKNKNEKKAKAFVKEVMQANPRAKSYKVGENYGCFPHSWSF